MLKKSILVSVLVYGSASAMAQAPIGPGMMPGGGESSMQPPVVRSRAASTIDTRPLADASTPYACACAEFKIDEFLAASAQAVATPTSLPGLGEQSAEFLQSQGGGSGGAPSAPEEGDAPALGSAPTPDSLAAGPGGENEESEGAQSFSASLPSDLEENSPFPQPFQLSSIVNVDVAASGQNPSGSDSEPNSERDDESGSSRDEAEAEASEGAANAEEEFEEL